MPRPKPRPDRAAPALFALGDPEPAAPPLAITAAAPEPSTIRAAASAVEVQAAAGEGKRPTFSITGYTGAAMSILGFYSPVILDLAGMRAGGQQIPALFAHDPERIVGQTDSVKIATDVRFTGVVTGDNADAAEVTSQAKNGFKWQASAGWSIDRREFLDAGKTATVNGRSVTGPMTIVRESTIKEISFVAIGADGMTSATVAASDPPGPRNGTPSMFEQWLQAKGIDPTAITDAVKTTLRAAYDAEQSAKAATVAAAATPAATATTPSDAHATQSLDAILDGRRTEDRRVADITAVADRWIGDRPTQFEAIGRYAKAAIAAGGTTPDQFELILLRELRAGGFTIHAPSGGPKADGKMLEATLCLAGGLDDPEKHFDAATLNAASDRFPRGLGLRDVLTIAARENGYHGHDSTDLRGLLRAAFGGGNGNAIRAEGFSTLSLPGILGNVANKFLAQGFKAVEEGWREISSVRPVRDFKAVTSYSFTGDMQFEKVGPTGELKHATAGELSYTNQADTYGKIFAITRKDIINDDLGALTQVPQKVGRGAALKLNDVFWTAWLAGVGVTWTSGLANLITGATTALSSAALKTALQTFRRQTDPDGKPLGITPRVLLVPPELEITAAELMTSIAVNTGGSSTTDKVPNRNIWTSKFKPVMSTYLSNSSYTGYSTTAFWLLADPMDLPSIETAFLNGRDMPFVETADAEFDTLGIQFRGYFDFGVTLQEYRAGVRSAGA